MRALVPQCECVQGPETRGPAAQASGGGAPRACPAGRASPTISDPVGEKPAQQVFSVGHAGHSGRSHAGRVSSQGTVLGVGRLAPAWGGRSHGGKARAFTTWSSVGPGRLLSNRLAHSRSPGSRAKVGGCVQGAPESTWGYLAAGVPVCLLSPTAPPPPTVPTPPTRQVWGKGAQDPPCACSIPWLCKPLAHLCRGENLAGLPAGAWEPG